MCLRRRPTTQLDPGLNVAPEAIARVFEAPTVTLPDVSVSEPLMVRSWLSVSPAALLSVRLLSAENVIAPVPLIVCGEVPANVTGEGPLVAGGGVLPAAVKKPGAVTVRSPLIVSGSVLDSVSPPATMVRL